MANPTDVNEAGTQSLTEVRREKSSHGTHWAAMHGGYFSDPSLADVFLGEVDKVIKHSRPDAIVDLGGGTGFLLSQLARRLPRDSGIRLLNMDLSEAQLAQTERPRVEPVIGSITDFLRNGLGDGRLLFTCRSVLHYVGIDGLRPALRHVRSQMRPGESFIHQSACVDTIENALCIDELFELMQSRKWLPIAPVLERCCNEIGLAVRRVIPAPPLRFESQEVAVRYGIEAGEMQKLVEHLFRAYGETPGFIERSAEGFILWIPYRIFVCEAQGECPGS
ncbi:MAG: hypothetical protein A2X49_04720 [Lentisphaerae bacterium GWF2_52_8]|nr:MAG: hypothetical protein A2X49_04720 [Lentisphaerae bacterium GWF2_52_8]